MRGNGSCQPGNTELPYFLDMARKMVAEWGDMLRLLDTFQLRVTCIPAHLDGGMSFTTSRGCARAVYARKELSG